MIQPYQEEDIYCPSCGKWQSIYLYNNETGFCIECTPHEPFCKFCGKNYKPDEFTKEFCYSCKREIWLRNNADELEQYMRDGLSFRQAEQRVLQDNRPNCLSCNNPIKGTRPGIKALFCSKSKKCRTASRRFRTLREKYGKDIALTEIQLELGKTVVE